MTVFEICEKSTKILQDAGIENAKHQTDILFEEAFGKRRFAVEPDYNIEEYICENIIKMAKKRAMHYPLQYICGAWPFMNVDIIVGEGVLIPRGDTETVVEYAIEKLIPMRKPKVLDLCSGSGAIAVSIKNELPLSDVTAVELSDDALKYLRLNATHLVQVVKADVFEYQNQILDSDYNMIISNPPYVTKTEMETVQTELFYEPRMALTDEGDGLKFYRHIVKNYYDKLKSGGYLVLEIGSTQAKDVCEMIKATPFTHFEVLKDYAGLDRCIIAKK